MESDEEERKDGADPEKCDIELVIDEKPILGDTSRYKGPKLLFPVDSKPPWHIVIAYALQQVMSSLSGPVTTAFIISFIVCGGDDQLFLAQLISSCVFMGGLCTFLQVTFGVRLPVIQGSYLAFAPILSAMMSTSQWRCPTVVIQTMNDTDGFAANTTSSFHDTSGNDEQVWKPRIMEASGSLIVSSVIECILGCTGVIGFLLQFIGPLTIAPVLMLSAFSIIPAITRRAQEHWAVSLSTACVFFIVSQFLRYILVPVPSYTRSRGFHFVRYPIFRLFPHLISIAYGWTLCSILTATDQLPSKPGVIGYRARTDTKSHYIERSSWFFIPYPGMWGMPTFSVGVFMGMMSATICSIIDSVGDYYAVARACDAPPPPKHAMNRGIAMEGIASAFCGFFGVAHATTTYSGNIGFIPLTGMGSRITWQVAGIFIMVAGIFGKFGAAMSTIPDPVLGGIMIIGLSMIIGVGVSNLHAVDLESSRNLIIFGVAILVGILIPDWMHKNPDVIKTGSHQWDQILTIMLSTEMLIGGFLGCFLDNVVPGSLEERGMTEYMNSLDAEKDNDTDVGDLKMYDLPWSDKIPFAAPKWFSVVPFLPSYSNRPLSHHIRSLRHCRKRKPDNTALTSVNEKA